MKQARLTRTYLAVPAHRARLVTSAAASAADAVFMDLEDAVPTAEKQAALEAAAEALKSLDWGSKTVAVRLNALDSQTIGQEIKTLGGIPRLDAVILPKAEQPADVATLAARLSSAAGGRPTPVDIELLIETALGLINVDALASSDQSVTALHLGVGDLAASIGARCPGIGLSPPTYRHLETSGEDARSYPLDLFAYPMMRVLVAARAFGLRAIDGPYGSFHDLAGTEANAMKAAAMGFDGKQVIHPSQIEATRRASIPSDAEIAEARLTLDALEVAEREGKGAVTVGGRMVDQANVRMIKRLLRFVDRE